MRTAKGTEVPPELSRALCADAAALAAFEAMPPSHQRRHAEVIAEAKKPETRERRAEQAIEMIRAWAKERAK